MRLLNATTLELKEFLGGDIPPYAILSHVWSSEELAYDDFINGRRKDGHGYEKILWLCQLAQTFEVESRLTPLQWCWVDTICIDKRSSAELSEAINSMYSWYESAKVCFVFLPDVDPLPIDKLAGEKPATGSGHPFLEYQFVESRWFSRGWTLQELIAPSNVLFFNTSYEIIGQKGVTTSIPRPLTDLIEKASGIRISSLLGRLSNNPRDVCIAQRMSWASNRQTTRAEDIAYCLLGIFDVNMPLLYGEGAANAFLRLQTEIIARFVDDSIFAWETDVDAPQPWSGLLAASPQAFRNCHDMYSVRPDGPHVATTYAITQRGLELTMPLDRSVRPRSETTWCFLYPLPCARIRKPSEQSYLKIWVESITTDGRNYADGYKLAWRSGLIWLESASFRSVSGRKFSNVPDTFSQRQFYRATRQALGWESPNLLRFNAMERELYDLTIEKSSVQDFLLRQKAYHVLHKLTGIGFPKQQRLIRLYFKTHFVPSETPIATAMARTFSWRSRSSTQLL